MGTEYAALLVEARYSPPPTLETLPEVGGPVVATATIKGKPSISQSLTFSGYEWDIGKVPNDGGALRAGSNAWTDAKGRLHLRVTHESGGWVGADVSLRYSLGYGLYMFSVSRISHFEPATVLGMLTWPDEIDVELSQWGDPAAKNTQFVIQPYYVAANVFRFVSPALALTHSFRWEPGQVSFRSAVGTDPGTPAVAEHIFTSGVPSPSAELVHVKLYVYDKSRIPQEKDVEVVIEKFEYLP